MFVDMYSEYGTGFDRSWLEGVCGYVIHDPEGKQGKGKGVGYTLVDLITPVYSLGGPLGPSTRIKWECAHTENLVEIARVPITNSHKETKS